MRESKLHTYIISLLFSLSFDTMRLYGEGGAVQLPNILDGKPLQLEKTEKASIQIEKFYGLPVSKSMNRSDYLLNKV